MDSLDLKRQRQIIRAGLARSNRSFLISALLVVLLALLAVWVARLAEKNADTASSKADQAQEAQDEVQDRLWDAYLAQARVERLSREAGHKKRGLDSIVAAAEIRSGSELVSEAVATLAAYDIGEEIVFHSGLPINYRGAFSSDLDRYVMIADSTHLTVNDAITGKPLHRLTMEAGYTGGVTFSPDDQFVSVCSAGRKWQFWDATTYEPVRTIDFPTVRVPLLRPAFHPTQDRVAFCGQDNTVGLFELKSNGSTRIPIPKRPNRVSFSKDGRRIAVAADTTLFIVDNGSLEILSTNEFEAKINEINWHPTDSSVVMAMANSDIVLFDSHNHSRMVMNGHSAFVSDAFFHPAGDIVVSHSWDRSTRFWDVSTGQLLLVARNGKAIRFSDSGDRLAFYRETAGVGIWEVNVPVGFKTVNAALKSSNSMSWVDHHPNQPLLVGNDEDMLYVWNSETCDQLFERQFGRLHSSTFSRDGNRLFVSGGEGLRVFDLQYTNSVIELNPVPIRDDSLKNARILERSSVSLDGNSFAVGGYNTGFVVDPENLEVQFEFGKGFSAVAYTALSPDSRWLVATSWKHEGTCIWDLEKQRYYTPLLRYIASSMEFSPDGKMLATCNNRGLQYWEVGTWKMVGRVRQNSSSYGPGAVRFSPDGGFVAASLDAPSISFFEPGGTNEIFRLSNPLNHFNHHFSMSRDGDSLYSASQSRAVHIWDFATLRQETGKMGLVWPLGSTTNKVDNSPVVREVVAVGSQDRSVINTAIVAGMLLAILFGAYALKQQKQLVVEYEKVERLAEEQNRKLLLQESEIQQSQKMKALGTLAAGVAHDFNNLLSVIGLSNDFLKRGTKGDPEMEEETTSIGKAVRQGRQVVESMLGYSRTANADGVTEFSLCELVEDTVGILSQQFLGGIRLTLELDRSANNIRASKGKIEQILLNLIINASDAMNGSGRLTIAVRSVAQPAETSNVLKLREDVKRVQILEVRDSGAGISQENLERIFEPFFTTKNVGAKQGTGLGLSTIFTIAEHEGFGLDVESNVSEGSAFRVILPEDPGRESRSDPGAIAG